MTDLTPEKRAELRAIDAAATEAPWCEHPNGTSAWRGPDWDTVNNSEWRQHRHVCNAASVAAAGIADIALIVAMRNSFGSLLDALEAKSIRVSELERGIEAAWDAGYQASEGRCPWQFPKNPFRRTFEP